MRSIARAPYSLVAYRVSPDTETKKHQSSVTRVHGCTPAAAGGERGAKNTPFAPRTRVVTGVRPRVSTGRSVTSERRRRFDAGDEPRARELHSLAAGGRPFGNRSCAGSRFEHRSRAFRRSRNR